MEAAEREALEWAARAVRRPWFQLLAVHARRAAGEPVGPEERAITGFFDLPFAVDAVWTYRLMRVGGLSVLFEGRPSLFVIVHDAALERVLWLGIQVAQGGLYTRHDTLHDKLPAGWDAPLLEALRRQAWEDADTEVRRLAAGFPDLPELPARVTLQIADLRFFERFREASAQCSSAALLPVAYGRAAVEVAARGWIRFTPDVPFDRALRLASKLAGVLGPTGGELARFLEGLLAAMTGDTGPGA